MMRYRTVDDLPAASDEVLMQRRKETEAIAVDEWRANHDLITASISGRNEDKRSYLSLSLIHI